MHAKTIYKTCLIAAIFFTTTAFAESSATEKTAAYFNSIKNSPEQLQMFLHKMPKGGDIHIHLDGATYAENLVTYGAKEGYCIDPKTFNAIKEKNCPAEYQLKNIHKNPGLYNKVIDAWSMENYQGGTQSYLTHFFHTFLRVQNIVNNSAPDIIQEIANRAAREHVDYLEPILAPFMIHLVHANGEDFASRLGDEAGWNNNFDIMREKLNALGMNNVVNLGVKNINAMQASAMKLMRCGTSQADPGCQTKMLYQFAVLRDMPPAEVFAQTQAAFEIAHRDPQLVRAVNIVLAEDGFYALRDYTLHMRIFQYFHKLYPNVEIDLHAGELAPGTTPPKDMTFHVREAVNIAGASRIGHGVDIAYEKNSQQLLNEMAQKQILVEECLTSNADILSVVGKAQPIELFLKNHVPVVLATDDDGVLRTDLTNEYKRAVETYHFSYPILKQFARNSISYSYIPGASIWSNNLNAVPVSACANNIIGSAKPSAACQQFLNSSKKAQMQWKLEAQLNTFEQGYTH